MPAGKVAHSPEETIIFVRYFRYKGLEQKTFTMKFAKLFLVLFSAVMWTSCSEDGRNARLEIRLTDAPGDYEEVNIDIQGVQVHTAGEDNGSGWKSLDITPGVYNLLELTNGLDTCWV